jgi:hypothetical protein
MCIDIAAAVSSHSRRFSVVIISPLLDGASRNSSDTLFSFFSFFLSFFFPPSPIFSLAASLAEA